VARVEHRARAARVAPAAARPGRVRFYGSVVPADSFREDLIAGLSQPQKQIPPKYFYDAAGSGLFDRICRLAEYYPTRTELAITRARLAAITRFAGAGCELIEYGSGGSRKTRLLIGALRPAAYVPVEISQTALAGAARRLAREFDWLHIFAVAGDFTQPLRLPVYRARPGRRRLVYFPGSTIGNFTPEDAQAFLRMTRAQVGRTGAMLVGVDLKKDPNVLHAAYNDARGVTAAFNLNLLARANRELGADFDRRRFRHYAFYNPARGRIEMHLVSLARQTVSVGAHRFSLEPGETIHTENSYKYAAEEFAALAAEAGFRAERVWTDRRGWFAVFGLVAA